MFSLIFKLSEVISAILAMRILVQFIGQAVGLLMLRQKRKDFPFKMPFYPWPVYIAIAMWCVILASTGYQMVLGGLLFALLGVAAYYIKQRISMAGDSSK